MELTCIMCPMGCTLKVTKKGKEVTVTGNSCPRGAIYGKQEVTAPERIITTVKNYKDGTICLKTSCPVPKDLVDKCLKIIKETPQPNSIALGDVLIKNIAGTSANLVVTEVND